MSIEAANLKFNRLIELVPQYCAQAELMAAGNQTSTYDFVGAGVEINALIVGAQSDANDHSGDEPAGPPAEVVAAVAAVKSASDALAALFAPAE